MQHGKAIGADCWKLYDPILGEKHRGPGEGCSELQGSLKDERRKAVQDQAFPARRKTTASPLQSGLLGGEASRPPEGFEYAPNRTSVLSKTDRLKGQLSPLKSNPVPERPILPKPKPDARGAHAPKRKAFAVPVPNCSLGASKTWLGSPSHPMCASHEAGTRRQRNRCHHRRCSWTARDPGWEPTRPTATFGWVFSLTDRAIYSFSRCKSCLRTRPWQCLAGLPARSRGLPATGRHVIP